MAGPPIHSPLTHRARRKTKMAGKEINHDSLPHVVADSFRLRLRVLREYPRSQCFAAVGSRRKYLRYAKTVYKKTASGRARDARKELHNARRSAAPER